MGQLTQQSEVVGTTVHSIGDKWNYPDWSISNAIQYAHVIKNKVLICYNCSYYLLSVKIAIGGSLLSVIWEMPNLPVYKRGVSIQNQSIFSEMYRLDLLLG